MSENKSNASLTEADIDFENFKLDDVRATEIRTHVESIRSEEWPEKFLMLVKEKGKIIEEEDSEMFPELKAKKGQEPRCYRHTNAEEQCLFEIFLEGSQLTVKRNKESAFEASFHPKTKDSWIHFVNEKLWYEMQEDLATLKEELKELKKLKAQRQKEWREKFKKKKS